MTSLETLVCETMEERLAVINMSTFERIKRLAQHTGNVRDEFDNLAMRALYMQWTLELGGFSNSEAAQALLIAQSLGDAFNAISWNLKHYPFVKEHHEHCHGFGWVMRDGRPFELSGSMGCPGDHCDLSKDALRNLVQERIQKAQTFLSEHADRMVATVQGLYADGVYKGGSFDGGGTGLGVLAAVYAPYFVDVPEADVFPEKRGAQPWNRYIILTDGEPDPELARHLTTKVVPLLLLQPLSCLAVGDDTVGKG